MTTKELENLVATFNELPVEDRQSFDQMRADRKVIRATPEERAHQDLQKAHIQMQVLERKLIGLGRNAATLNTNQTKHFQMEMRSIDSLGGDHEVIHKMLTAFLIQIENDRKETESWRANVMEMLEAIKEGR